MSWNPFNSFPREMGFPHRSSIVFSINDFLDKVNNHNHKTDVYTSLYSFRTFQSNSKPDFNSANITHIYLDLDNENSLENCRKLHSFLKEEDLKHCINFSGGGFHCFISTEYPNYLKNKKSAIFNATIDLAEKLHLKIGINGDSDIDAHTVGDIARIVRVPNTYNIKRKRYCIPMSEESLLKSIEEIHQMAKDQIHNYYPYGSKSIDLNPFDCEPKEEYRIPIMEINDSSIGIDNLDISKFPTCVQKLLSTKLIKHRERFIIITYCKEIGLPIRDTIFLLKKYLDIRVWNHCVNEERQPIFIYKRADLVFPSCEKIKFEGLCNNECKRKQK